MANETGYGIAVGGSGRVAVQQAQFAQLQKGVFCVFAPAWVGRRWALDVSGASKHRDQVPHPLPMLTPAPHPHPTLPFPFQRWSFWKVPELCLWQRSHSLGRVEHGTWAGMTDTLRHMEPALKELNRLCGGWSFGIRPVFPSCTALSWFRKFLFLK